ncbi:MAG: hypothetical protein AB8H86_05810 [Polyangiales bacterium]
MFARFLLVALILTSSACNDAAQEPLSAEVVPPAPTAEQESVTPPSPSTQETQETPEAAQDEPETEAETEAEEPGLPTKMGRRLSNQLRQLVGARVALPHILHDALPSGGDRVLGVMSYSEHEACVGRHETRAEGRAECQADEDCLQYGTFAAEFAAPRPRTPEGHGGALTMVAPQALTDLNLVCAEAIEIKQLELVDIDGDGELELMYDAIFRSEHDAFRGGGTFTTARRILRVLRLDGTEQISLPLSSWGGDLEATEAQYARRVRFEGAPNPALIVEEIEYESMDGTSCAVDEAFFATDYRRTDSAECTGELVTLSRAYDAECDCWRTEEEAAEAAPTAAETPAGEVPAEGAPIPAEGAPMPTEASTEAPAEAPTEAAPVVPSE